MSMKMDPLQRVRQEALALSQKPLSERMKPLTKEQAKPSAPTPVQKSDAERAKLRESVSGF